MLLLYRDVRPSDRLQPSGIHVHVIFSTNMEGMKYSQSITREKEGDLTQSYDKTPYTNRKFENQRTTHKRLQKLRLHNDCGPI